MALIRSAFFGVPEQIDSVYGSGHMDQVASLTDLLPGIWTCGDLSDGKNSLTDVEILLTTWGMPELTLSELDCLPNLRLVLYAAGDVRGFARPLIERGIQVTSAWRANAVPVVEFTLAHILLAGKSYLRNVEDYRSKRVSHMGRVGSGNCGETVGILGAGAIGLLLFHRL